MHCLPAPSIRCGAASAHTSMRHAIAACNLAEMAMGMVAEATVPSTHRWLPKGMTTEYLKITSGGLTATAELDEIPDFSAITSGVEIPVPVTFSDAEGKESVRATRRQGAQRTRPWLALPYSTSVSGSWWSTPSKE